MSRRGGEEIATMKGPAERRETILGGGQLDGQDGLCCLGEGEAQEPVVGSDVALLSRLNGEGSPHAPHPGIDHGQVNRAPRKKSGGGLQTERALEDVLGAISWLRSTRR